MPLDIQTAGPLLKSEPAVFRCLLPLLRGVFYSRAPLLGETLAAGQHVVEAAIEGVDDSSHHCQTDHPPDDRENESKDHLDYAEGDNSYNDCKDQRKNLFT